MRTSICRTAAASLALLGSLISAPALASSLIGQAVDEWRDTVERGRHALIADIDNDSMLLRRDDGLYTSGLRIASQYTVEAGTQATTAGWRLGQELYTSSDTSLPPSRIPRNDHPYAGWLYAGVFHRIDRADGSSRQIGVDVGCFGACAGGEWTQKNLHRLINQAQPQGWSSQLRNEPGVVLYAAMAPLRWRPLANVDLTPTFYGRFGNIFTDAGATLTMRAGRLNSLPQARTLHAFLRADVRAVAYNATMQGGYFSSDNPNAVAPKRAVGEAEIGIAWQGERYGMSAGIVRRSNEVADLPSSIGRQNFARVQLTFRP